MITAREWNALLVAAAALLLGIALVMEYAFGLEPCPLCMMQRLWVVAFGLVIGTAMLLQPGADRLGIWAAGAITTAAIGAGFSIRQLWLQHLPPDQVPACGPGLDYMLDTLPFSQVLLAMLQGTGDCATVVWSFLGLSTPGWSLLGFVALAAGAALHFLPDPNTWIVHDRR